jgi:para-nitrobenzyl esterase
MVILRFALAAVLVLSVACTSTSQRASESNNQGLAGTSWQLVRFQPSEGAGFAPAQPDKYTIAFESQSAASVRFDCNWARGTWKSAEPNQIEFDALALTRVSCAPESHHDAIVERWSSIRSYQVRDGHLFLSMQEDAGVFEFEPTSTPSR